MCIVFIKYSILIFINNLNIIIQYFVNHIINISFFTYFFDINIIFDFDVNHRDFHFLIYKGFDHALLFIIFNYRWLEILMI